MLAQPVKASAVTHLTDARYFAAWEVDFLGFDLSPEGVNALELSAVVEWIQGPKLIGELDAIWPSRSAEHEVLLNLPLDGYQVDTLFGRESIEQLLRPTGRPVFLEYVVEGYGDADALRDGLAEYASVVDHFLLNFKKGGIEWADLLAGQPYSIDFLQALTQQYSCWLEIDGALPQEIKAALPDLKGFSVRGGSEEKVGYKDFDDLADFFEDLEVEN